MHIFSSFCIKTLMMIVALSFVICPAGHASALGSEAPVRPTSDTAPILLATPHDPTQDVAVVSHRQVVPFRGEHSAIEPLHSKLTATRALQKDNIAYKRAALPIEPNNEPLDPDVPPPCIFWLDDFPAPPEGPITAAVGFNTSSVGSNYPNEFGGVDFAVLAGSTVAAGEWVEAYFCQAVVGVVPIRDAGAKWTVTGDVIGEFGYNPTNYYVQAPFPGDPPILESSVCLPSGADAAPSCPDTPEFNTNDLFVHWTSAGLNGSSKYVVNLFPDHPPTGLFKILFPYQINVVGPTGYEPMIAADQLQILGSDDPPIPPILRAGSQASRPGIKITVPATAQPPFTPVLPSGWQNHYDGNYSFVQIIHIYRTEVNVPDDTGLGSDQYVSDCATFGGNSLDSVYPYSAVDMATEATGTSISGLDLPGTGSLEITTTEREYPGVPPNSTILNLTWSFKATMYLMWTPTDRKGIPTTLNTPVALGHVDWSVQGTVYPDPTPYPPGSSNALCARGWCLTAAAPVIEDGFIQNDSYPSWDALTSLDTNPTSCVPFAKK